MSTRASLPLYLRVKDAILQQIFSEELGPGSLLPTEEVLAAQHNVSRATVRSALADLEREGLITKQRGSRTRVAMPNASLAFEPLISLNFSLQRMGLKIQNTVIVDEIAAFSVPSLAQGFAQGVPTRHLTRVRCSNNLPIAVEDTYFAPEYSEFLDALSPEDSIAHAMLNTPDFSVEKVDMQLAFRRPTPDERRYLRMKSSSRVLELTRWIYGRQLMPVNFVRFVMPEAMLKYPFSMLAIEQDMQ